MSEAMHTALPWNCCENERCKCSYIFSEDGEVVAVAETKENAKFTVTAVNERPALLKQIAELKEALEYALRKNEVPGADLDGTDGWVLPPDHWMAKARATLENTKKTAARRLAGEP